MSAETYGNRGVLLLNAVGYHNTSIVGKAPLMCGFTSRRMSQQQRQAHKGRFVMEMKKLQAGDSFTSRFFSTNCGIYAIVNKANGKAYIGQSVNILSRFGNHYNALMSDKHSNKALLRDWQTYGRYKFEFRIVETCKAKMLYSREIYWMLTWKPQSYNVDIHPHLLRYEIPTSSPASKAERIPNRASNEFVADMLTHYQESEMSPYLREIFDRWLTLETTQEWAAKNGRILPNTLQVAIGT